MNREESSSIVSSKSQPQTVNCQWYEVTTSQSPPQSHPSFSKADLPNVLQFAEMVTTTQASSVPILKPKMFLVSNTYWTSWCTCFFFQFWELRAHLGLTHSESMKINFQSRYTWYCIFFSNPWPTKNRDFHLNALYIGFFLKA